MDPFSLALSALFLLACVAAGWSTPLGSSVTVRGGVMGLAGSCLFLAVLGPLRLTASLVFLLCGVVLAWVGHASWLYLIRLGVIRESGDARHEGPRCVQCGYYLIGLTEKRCPECGRPFN